MANARQRCVARLFVFVLNDRSRVMPCTHNRISLQSADRSPLCLSKVLRQRDSHQTATKVVRRSSSPLCVSGRVAPFLVQFLVAVLMAVRYQLFCFWLRRIAIYI